MTCPCKGCEKAGCGSLHDSCEAYQAWSAERQEMNRQRNMANEHGQLSNQQIHKHWKNLKAGRTVSRR